MTPDLTEQRLREQLAAAVDAESGSYLDIDATGVLDVGHRVQRRRRAFAVGATAVCALVVGAGGWTALTRSTGDEQTLPATTPSVSVSLPEPVAELPLGAIPPAGRTQPLVAAVGLADSGQQAVFSLRTEQGDVVASRKVPLGESEKPRWATLIPGLTVAVLPSGSTGAVPVWTSREPPQGGVRQILRGRMTTAMPDGRVLAAWWTDGRTQRSFADVIWTDGESVHTSYADSLSSVALDEHVLFAGGSGRLLGFFAPPVGTDSVRHGEATAPRDVDEGTVPAVWVEDSGDAGGTYATYLPPVREVELVTGDGAEVRDLTIHDLPGETGVLVTARVDGDRESVTDVRYTDLDGGSTTAPAPAS
jgi:hypothetical protein